MVILELVKYLPVSYTHLDTCNLTVIGTSDRINALTNDDIKVYVDVVGLKKGRHNVKLEVELSDETLTYRLDSDEQIRVNIKK